MKDWLNIDKLEYNTYDEYKDSKIEWLGYIPNHFKINKIKDNLKSIISGGTPTSTNDCFWNGNINWCSIGDISKNEYIYKTSKKITLDGQLDKNLKIIPINTLLYSVYATLGKVSITKIETTINQALLALFENNNINKFFLKYYLQKIESELLLFANYTTQYNLSINIVKNIYTILPSKKEQLAIVKFLDEKTTIIDKKIEILKKQNELEKELEKVLINQCVTKGVDSFTKLDKNGNLIDFDNKLNRNKEEFDLYMNENGYIDSKIEWLGYIPNHFKINRIKNNFKVFNGNSIKEDKKNNFIDNNIGINFIGTKDINNFKINYNSELKIPKQENFKLLEEYTPLLCIEGGSAGKKIAITNQKIHFGNKLCSFNNNSILLKKYMYYYLQSQPFQLQFNNELSGMIEGVSIGIIRNLYNIVISKKEQLEIVKFLDNKTQILEQKRIKREKEITLLEEYKKTLINDVVTGKIKVIKD